MQSRYVLLIGAFERDNFGDILLGILSTRLLAPTPVLWGAVMGRDMRPFGGQIVMSLADARPFLNVYHPVGVIHCGGETMSAGTLGAVSMDVNRPLYSAGTALGWHIARQVADRHGVAGYVNSPQDLFYPDIEGTPPIGFTSVGGVPREELASHVAGALAAARFVSVRDPAAAAFASYRGIEARLAPDSVHTVADLFPLSDIDNSRLHRQAQPHQTPYLVFQAREHCLREHYDVLVEQLVECSRALQLTIVLQPAGTVTGHDSIQQLTELKADLETRRPYGLPTLQPDRDVWAQVSRIAHAQLWMGTSLHGQIVACAYGVPSVGFGSEKVMKYFSHWAPSICAGVDPKDILAAAARVFAIPHQQIVQQNRVLAALVTANWSLLTRAVIPGAPYRHSTAPYDPAQVLSAELDRLRHLAIDTMIQQ